MMMPSMILIAGLVTRLKRDFSVRRIHCMENMQRTL